MESISPGSLLCTFSVRSGQMEVLTLCGLPRQGTSHLNRAMYPVSSCHVDHMGFEAFLRTIDKSDGRPEM